MNGRRRKFHVAVAAALVVSVAGLTPASSPPGESLRDRIADQALTTLGAEIAPCWGRIEERAPMILFCGATDTADYRGIRKQLDASILAHEEVSKANGRWLWQNQREYLGRGYETTDGPLEARIYVAKQLVVIGYRVEMNVGDVEVRSCSDPELVERYAAVPQHDPEDPDFQSAIQTLQVPALYPELALATRLSGEVQVRARVLADGSLADVCVVSCNRANFGFEKAAIAAVETWRFEPARYQGQPVESVLDSVVVFHP